MSESLANFRDLKGIGPATEARLHEAGIYTWEALAVAATALAAVRGDGDTLREVANLVVARGGEAGGPAAPRLPGGEHLEAFVLRMALTSDGEPRRCTLTHVRTMAEQAWAGWLPADLIGFLEEHSGMRPAAAAQVVSPANQPAPEEQAPPVQPVREQSVPEQAPPQQPSTEHLVVLDAGKTIGGADRDIVLVIPNTQVAGTEFDYHATLAARPLGTGTGNRNSRRNGGNGGAGWTALARKTGTGSPAHELALRFPAVGLPPGIQRLQLRLEVKLPRPTSRAPALALAPGAPTG